MLRIAVGTAGAALAAVIATGVTAAGTPDPTTVADSASVVAPVHVTSATLGAANSTPAAQQDVDSLETRFLGGWRLGSIFIAEEDGGRVYPYGKDAGGALLYGRDGNMALSVWKANRRPFAVGDPQKGTSAEYRAAVQSYVQYMGTFTLDRRARTVSHHVAQSVYPNWNGTTQTRAYAFSKGGRVLTLTTPPLSLGGATGVFTVVWRR